MSAWRTQERTDSTPYPSWRATRYTVPCSVPNSARKVRTIRTAAAFSSGLYLRVVGLPGDCSFGMTPSSFHKVRSLHISQGDSTCGRCIGAVCGFQRLGCSGCGVGDDVGGEPLLRGGDVESWPDRGDVVVGTQQDGERLVGPEQLGDAGV